jgi:hypothetical protein
MKRVRCQSGIIVFVSLFLALGIVNLVPGTPLVESSLAEAALDETVPSDINETLVITPISRPVYWGWKGNLTFVYWDIANDTGIANATVICQGWHPELGVVDHDNGTYSIWLDTTQKYIEADRYTTIILVIAFQKENYETQVVTYPFRISKVPTEVLIQVTEFNVNGSIFDLIVPVGDTLDIRFFYNDTDASDGYVGGLAGAYTSATLYGPTLVRRESTLDDLGNGNYSYLFDTNEGWLFEATGGVPFPHELPYYLDVEVALENRTTREAHIRIYIIEIPTGLVPLNFENEINMYTGTIFTAFLWYYDAWPGHESNPILNASVSAESSAPNTVRILSIEADGQEAGLYHINILCNETWTWVDVVNLSLSFEKENYETQTWMIIVNVQLGEGPRPPPPPIIPYGAIIIVAVAWFCYRRNKERIFPAAATEEDAVPPNQAPNSLET